MQPEINQTLPTLHTHEEAVLWFISRLDWEMVSELLDDNRTYQDFPKWEFIDKLRELFEQFIVQGDTRLLIFSGRCNGCDCDNFKKGGYIFFGNHTKNYFNLLIEINDNEHITDMYECSDFKTTFQPNFRAGSCFYIDNIEDPF